MSVLSLFVVVSVDGGGGGGVGVVVASDSSFGRLLIVSFGIEAKEFAVDIVASLAVSEAFVEKQWLQFNSDDEMRWLWNVVYECFRI